MLRNDQLVQWDRDHLIHPYTNPAMHADGTGPHRIVQSGSGAYITDRDGNTFLDAFAGLYCVNIGFGRQEVIQAIAEQAKELAYFHAYMGYSHEPGITLAKMVLERTPKGMAKVFFGLSGSDANETNIKLVWLYNNLLGRPQKKKIISRWRAYHGSGLMTGSLTGLDVFHKMFDLPLKQVHHTVAPYYYRREHGNQSQAEFVAYCVQSLEELIAREGADTIAAFIGEPALGSGGLVPPPEGYWDAIQPVLKKHDILMIADEVITGFGRTGRLFASDLYGIQPDLMTIAKGLTSAYAPLSGSIVSESVWKVIEEGLREGAPLGHGWTYAAHPIGAAAGIANLKVIDDLGLVRNAERVGTYLRNHLHDRLGAHPHVGEIRGQGMMIAVEFVENREKRQFFDPARKIGMQLNAAMLRGGVITRALPQSDVLGYSPPLCLTEAEADKIVDATVAAVKEVLA